MASRDAVLRAFKVLGRLGYAGDVSRERVEAYEAAFEDLPDDVLTAAVVKVGQTYIGEFIPPAAVIREAAGANAVPAVDGQMILARLQADAGYTPYGWNHLSAQAVRSKYGDLVADLYVGAGGGPRLFSENATTRDIAGRDFQRALNDAVRAHGLTALPEGFRPALGAGAEPKRIGAGEPQPDDASAPESAA